MIQAYMYNEFQPFDELLFCIVYRIVEKINISIGQDPNSKAIIGVLDIYGFESFKQNRQALSGYLICNVQ